MLGVSLRVVEDRDVSEGIERLFRPRGVAVVGSASEGKIGYHLIGQILAGGYRDVFAVNPRAQGAYTVPGYQSVAEIESPDEIPTCTVCKDTKRDHHLLCVVARVQDLLAIERAGTMRGRYFVLGKLLSPLEGIGPDELPLERLAARLKEDEVTEVIVATPPSVDGEATALLLKRELAPLGVTLTRIASGVPHGGDLEYADPITMGRAFAGRQRL